MKSGERKGGAREGEVGEMERVRTKETDGGRGEGGKENNQSWWMVTAIICQSMQAIVM